MRLFTAIDLPDSIKSALERLIRQLRPAAHIKWSPRENLHITTRFIGEWPEDRIGELKERLAPVPAVEPFDLTISGLGWFPNPHSPRVFWAGIQAPPALKQLAAATDAALEPLGIEREKRAFSPHLTLARIKEPTDLAPLRQAVAQLESQEFGSCPVDRFYLYRSQTHPSGSVYTQMAEFPFAK